MARLRMIVDNQYQLWINADLVKCVKVHTARNEFNESDAASWLYIHFSDSDYRVVPDTPLNRTALGLT